MLSRKVYLAALVFVSTIYAATLSGSAKITPQDYIGLGKLALQTTYPACSMPYSELNLARITAVQNMNTASTCGLCLKVTGANTGKSIYVLAVDLGGSGLDLSIPSFEYLFNQKYDASPASWTTVDDSYCVGIYTPGKTNPNQGISASSITTKFKTTTTRSSLSIKKTVYTKKTTSTKNLTAKTTVRKTNRYSKARSTKKITSKYKKAKKTTSTKNKTTTKRRTRGSLQAKRDK